MEYVDAINSQDIPVVMNCFERVVQVESRRFTEKLYEELCNRLRAECDFMPCDPEALELKLEEVLTFGESRLNEILGEIATVDSLIDIRSELDKRLRTFFKHEILTANYDASEHHCASTLHTLSLSHSLARALKLNEDLLDPAHFPSVRKDLAAFLIAYLKLAKGPARDRALSEHFQSWALDAELT